MRKTGKKRDEEQSAAGQMRFPFRGFAREALWDSVILSGFGFVQDELEAERTALCGERYAHQEHRQAVRAGHVPSSLVLGGRRVELRRPRARSTDGHELRLPSWQAWSSHDPLDERAYEQMVLGVSTRRYARSLEPLPQEVEVRGISKSAVSERFVVGTQRRLAELMQRDLSGLRLVALLIDGVHFAEHVVLAAVGIDVDGEKHPLGLREGATENTAACKALLEDLIERGLNPNRALLVVIDGAKALAPGGPRHLRRARADPALPGAQEAQRHRRAARKDASFGSDRDEPGVCDWRSEARPPTARESCAQAGIGSSGRSSFVAGRSGRDPDSDGAAPIRDAGTGTVLDQLDRKLVQPGPRGCAAGQMLAGRNHDPALDRRRCARSRASLPQGRRVSRIAETGRRAS